jgi:hypothetical protein
VASSDSIKKTLKFINLHEIAIFFKIIQQYKALLLIREKLFTTEINTNTLVYVDPTTFL